MYKRHLYRNNACSSGLVHWFNFDSFLLLSQIEPLIRKEFKRNFPVWCTKTLAALLEAVTFLATTICKSCGTASCNRMGSFFQWHCFATDLCNLLRGMCWKWISIEPVTTSITLLLSLWIGEYSWYLHVIYHLVCLMLQTLVLPASNMHDVLIIVWFSINAMHEQNE